MATIPPTVDGVLLPWSLNFSTRINSTPTIFDLTAAEAASYLALHTDMAAKMAVAENPGTRTKSTVAAKNVSKNSLLIKARAYAKVIKASLTVTDPQRIDLGLPPRDSSLTPVPVPGMRPLLVIDAYGNLELRDESMPARRGKPAGTIGAVVFTMILPAAAPAPINPDDLRYSGFATRDQFSVPVPPGSTGKMMYAMAMYLNGKGQAGPVSAVVASSIAA